ncbi:DUF6197 family protein [Streptomyces sp. NPDC004082]
MTTTALAPTTTAVLDLDARMALALAVMDERCTIAVLAVDVNAAHIATEPLPEITAPLPLTPTLTPSPYTTPIASTLHRARHRLEIDGWTTGALRDEQGARCPIGAIRVEASSRREADDACVILLEAIQRDFRDADTIPSWNDQQTSPRFPILYLGKAADLAHARNL